MTGGPERSIIFFVPRPASWTKCQGEPSGSSTARSAGKGGLHVKVKASVKRVCGACQVVRRKGKVRVICKADPKHKQVQG